MVAVVRIRVNEWSIGAPLGGPGRCGWKRKVGLETGLYSQAWMAIWGDRGVEGLGWMRRLRDYVCALC